MTNKEPKYTSHEALEEWREKKGENDLTQNIVALLGIHGMHCQFYRYEDASHITKAFVELFDQTHQATIAECVRIAHEMAGHSTVGSRARLLNVHQFIEAITSNKE
jgi:hypothetical protein